MKSMDTTYSIKESSTGFMLECVSGLYKSGLETIPVKDKPALIEALVTLGYPRRK